jgi:hypothetical protein
VTVLRVNGVTETNFNKTKNELLDKLRSRSYAEHVVVFGSTATGKEVPGDIDVFVDQSSIGIDEFMRSNLAGELLWFSRKYYGSFDPFVLLSQGVLDGKSRTILITRNEYGNGWIKAKHSREILKGVKSHGIPLLSVANLKLTTH